jgi:site-specific DNA-methyltransferase (adenine-specific)/adenine-specific DNA-methyltransferase
MPKPDRLPGSAPAEKVEDMTFELPKSQPIKGFPELRWAGKRPFTSTHYYPAQLKERYGDSVDGWMNRIYWGDNLQVMSHLLKEFRGKVDLVYIDPPFGANVNYKKIITAKNKLITNDISSFEESQYTDIWAGDNFLQFIYERLILIRELLSDRGNIYVHCDWRVNGYFRLILDEIFGKNFFKNEISWKRKTGSSSQIGSTTDRFGHDVDTILFYGKTSNVIFNMQYTESDPEYIKLFYKHKNETGRIYRIDNLANPGYRPNLIYEYKGYPPPPNGWAISREKMEQWDKEGRLEFPKNPNGRIQRRRFLDELKGKPVSDIWDDIGQIGAQSNERLGYPTQKPEVLLERIILASSSLGSIIFDCFMGSGTTQAVAMKLGRRFIGADINLGAIQTTTKRLNGIIAERKQERKILLDADHPLYLNFEVYNVNNYDIFRNPVQARDLLIKALEIDSLDSTDVFDGLKDGYKVKIMPVNRIASRVDLNPIISGINYRELDRNMENSPGSPADRLMLVCMGHEPDLAAVLKMEIGIQYKIDVQVVDILRDRTDLTFKYDSEAEIAIESGELFIRQFYPRNLLQKLSLLPENVDEWRELVDTVAIDWNYNGEVLRPTIYDNPGKNELVQGRYKLPGDYGQIRVKITDLLSESLEMTVEDYK